MTFKSIPMEKVMILSTAEEIAEGLLLFMSNHQKTVHEPSFESERMTVGEASQFASVSYRTFCNWINEGKVPVNGAGRTRFVLKSELIDSLKNMK